MLKSTKKFWYIINWKGNNKMKKRNFKNKELQEFEENVEEFIINSLTESYKGHSYEEAKQMTEKAINNIIKQGEKGLQNMQTFIIALFSMTQARVVKAEHNKDFVLFVKRMVDKLYYSEVKKSGVNK